MSDGVKEMVCTGCTGCSHLAVCKYKEDFLNIHETLSRTDIAKTCADGKEIRLVPVTNFEFIEYIAIKCRYFEEA